MTPAEVAQHFLLWAAANNQQLGVMVLSWVIGVCLFVGTSFWWGGKW